MKYVKMLGLAAVVAAALMAFVGSTTASATVLCKVSVTANDRTGFCPTGQGYSGEIHAVSEEEPVLTGTINVHCDTSTMQGSTTEGTEGGSTDTPHGAITVLTFDQNCNCEVVVVHPGSLEIHAEDDLGNGIVTSSGAEVTVNCNTIFGKVHCIYTTEQTDIGTLTGSSTTGKTATLDTTANIPQTATSGLCSSSAVWHAKYEITTPDFLDVATGTKDVA